MPGAHGDVSGRLHDWGSATSMLWGEGTQDVFLLCPTMLQDSSTKGEEPSVLGSLGRKQRLLVMWFPVGVCGLSTRF